MEMANQNNFTQLNGKQGERLLAGLSKTSPRLHNLLCEYLGDDLYQDQTIPLKTRLLCVISAITTLGGMENPLRFYVKTALDNGVSRDEIIAVIETLATYVGTPKALGALFTTLEVAKEN